MFIQISWSRIGKPYNYAEFLCETDSDVAALPTQKGKCAVGSKAFVLSSSKTYILNNNNQWVVYNASGPSPTTGDGYTLTEQDKQDIADIAEADLTPTILNAFPTDVASGAVASFPDGADDLPLKSLVVNINPVQDLHEQESPYPAGGGKNKFNGTFLQGYWAYADGGWVNSNAWIATEKIPCKPSTSYTASADAKLTRWQGFVWYDANGDYISTDNLQSNVNIGLTKTSPNNAYYLAFNIAGYPTSIDPISPSNVTHFQLEEGQTATAYAPYSNICPISGWTGAKVTRTGKNLANDAEFSIEKPSWSTVQHWIGLSENADGTFTLTRPVGWGGAGYVYIGTFKAGTYKLSFDLISTANVTCGAVCLVKKKQTWDDGSVVLSVTSLTATGRYSFNAFTIIEECDVWIAVGPFNTNGAEVISGNYQLELGSSASTYSPYSGSSIPITFPSEAGTVYGGMVDVTNGKLTVTHGQIASYAGESLPGEWISDRDVYSAAGGTPTTGAQVVYELATPQTYQLTPTEVTTLLGDNTIWADTGDTEVEYRADTKLYISKKIAEVDGHTPVKGVDYWTAADKAELVADVLAEFVDLTEVAQ